MACGFFSRLSGLLLKPPLDPNQGLCLAPCAAIHTVGMRYPLDVVFLDKGLRVCKCVHGLEPNRFAVCWAAAMVIELPSGYCSRHPDYLTRIHSALHKVCNVL